MDKGPPPMPGPFSTLSLYSPIREVRLTSSRQVIDDPPYAKEIPWGAGDWYRSRPHPKDANPVDDNVVTYIDCGGCTFWAYGRVDNDYGVMLRCYDRDGNFVRSVLGVQGARYPNAMDIDPSSGSVRVYCDEGGPVVFKWSDLGMTAYKVTKAEILEIARSVDIPLTDADAAALEAALPEFNCCTCSHLGTPLLQKRSVNEVTWTTGAATGAVIGLTLGGLIGGPPGAILGSILAAQIGAGIGLTLGHAQIPSAKIPEPGEVWTLIWMQSYGIGPFPLSSPYEDLLRPGFLMFGKIPLAGAVANPDKSGALQAWYPSGGVIKSPPRPDAGIPMRDGREIYTYIFVVVKTNAPPGPNGNAYQMRIHPEDPFVHGKERINHNQLTEGCRWAAVLGYEAMQVYGAGVLYVIDGKITALSSRSGHYFQSFQGQDDLILMNAAEMLRGLGYDMSDVKITVADTQAWLTATRG